MVKFIKFLPSENLKYSVKYRNVRGDYNAQTIWALNFVIEPCDNLVPVYLFHHCFSVLVKVSSVAKGCLRLFFLMRGRVEVVSGKGREVMGGLSSYLCT